MKKLVLTSSALIFAFGTTLSVPTMASAKKTPDVDIEEVCEQIAMDPRAVSAGLTEEECLEEAESGNAAKICQFLLSGDYLPDEVEGVRVNQGRCVSTLRHFQNDQRKAGN